ncbi:MAG TPA: hypothetical protein VHZ55_04470 [Bryobacteraceae bacterium]|nr:hypothetical protein [Bryobacteraceae bacterium]
MLTLAIGIGANTAIFTVVHAFYPSPLEYLGSERLVLLPGGAIQAHFEELKKGRSFSAVGAFAVVYYRQLSNFRFRSWMCGCQDSGNVDAFAEVATTESDPGCRRCPLEC